jgi:hypothetical protein
MKTRNRLGLTATMATLLSGIVTALPAPAIAQDIAGTYAVEGKNPDGTAYSGTAVIAGSAGGNCKITWSLANNQTTEAFCLRQDDVLAASYRLDKSIGLIIYRIEEIGVLDGTWSLEGREGVGTERLSLRE